MFSSAWPLATGWLGCSSRECANMRPSIHHLLLGGIIAATPAAAQTPFQGLQQAQTNLLAQQAQAGLLSRQSPLAPAQGVVQALPNLVGPDRMVNRQGTATESEGGPVAVGPLGDGDRAAGATAVFGASLFTREATAVSDAP